MEAALHPDWNEPKIAALVRFLRNTHGIFVTDAQKVQVLEWVEAGENPAEIALRLEAPTEAEAQADETGEIAQWLDVPCEICGRGKSNHREMDHEYSYPTPPSMRERLNEDERAEVYDLCKLGEIRDDPNLTAEDKELIASFYDGQPLEFSMDDALPASTAAELAFGQHDLDGTDNSAAESNLCATHCAPDAANQADCESCPALNDELRKSMPEIDFDKIDPIPF